MREGENIALVEGVGFEGFEVDRLKVDMMGFIFYPESPRYVTAIPSYLPLKAKRVGVFVNENIDVVVNIASSYKLNYIQLHGNESPEYCNFLKSKGYLIIKAFSIACSSDILNTISYDRICDIFIFDTKCSSVGGSGESFDWQLLTQYNGTTPFMLSGGLGLHNIDSILEFHHPMLIGYDLNSAFETSPAVKSVDKLTLFLNKLNNRYDQQNR